MPSGAPSSERAKEKGHDAKWFDARPTPDATKWTLEGLITLHYPETSCAGLSWAARNLLASIPGHAGNANALGRIVPMHAAAMGKGA